MIALLLRILCVVTLASPAVSIATPAFEYGPRPPLCVFDPTEQLKPETVKELSESLAAIYQKEGIDVIVVILNDLGKAPPEHVAKRFAEAWSKSSIHCVILQVSDHADSPWVVPGGKILGYLNPDQVQLAVASIQRHAAAEPRDEDKIITAANESADMLRYWMANAINRSAMIQTESAKMRKDLETKARQRQVAVMIAAGTFIPIIAGISLLVVVLRSRRPAYFPDPAWQPRLGAPHAGGNHAVADLGPPLP